MPAGDADRRARPAPSTDRRRRRMTRSAAGLNSAGLDAIAAVESHVKRQPLPSQRGAPVRQHRWCLLVVATSLATLILASSAGAAAIISVDPVWTLGPP